MAKILLIEDDIALALAIADALDCANHTVEHVADGREGADRLKLYQYDLAIIDWQLPLVNGIEIILAERKRGSRLPILMLTGKGAVEERVTGLDSGADDYLAKPFDLNELLARIRTLLRRPQNATPASLGTKHLQLDMSTLTATIASTKVSLLPREANLLAYLLQHKNRAFTVYDLLHALWQDEPGASEDAVRQCVTRLRKKLAIPGLPETVKTVRGMGYVIED